MQTAGICIVCGDSTKGSGLKTGEREICCYCVKSFIEYLERDLTLKKNLCEIFDIFPFQEQGMLNDNCRIVGCGECYRLHPSVNAATYKIDSIYDRHLNKIDVRDCQDITRLLREQSFTNNRLREKLKEYELFCTRAV